MCYNQAKPAASRDHPVDQHTPLLCPSFNTVLLGGLATAPPAAAGGSVSQSSAHGGSRLLPTLSSSTASRPRPSPSSQQVLQAGSPGGEAEAGGGNRTSSGSITAAQSGASQTASSKAGSAGQARTGGCVAFVALVGSDGWSYLVRSTAKSWLVHAWTAVQQGHQPAIFHLKPSLPHRAPKQLFQPPH